MKKSIFKKLGGLFLGLAMGLGVAVGVTSKENTNEVKAENNDWVRVTSIDQLFVEGGATFIIGYEATAKSGTIVPLRSKDSNATTSANGYFNTGTTDNSSTSNTIDMTSNTLVTSDYEVFITKSSTQGYINIQMKNSKGSYYGATSGGTTSNKARLYNDGNSAETNLLPEWSSESNNQFKLTSNVSGSYKYFKYNTSSPRFAFYNSAGSNIVFYMKNDSGITITGNSSAFAGGSDVQLEAKCKGVSLDGCTWKSDNEYVATVNNGIVTPLRVGTATITATKQNYTTGSFDFTVNLPENLNLVTKEQNTGNFEKILTAPLNEQSNVDWTGTYIFVYEKSATQAYVFNGVDENEDYVITTINNGIIEIPETPFVTIDIEKYNTGYSLKINGGANDNKYLCNTSVSKGAYNNGLTFSTDPQENSIDLNSQVEGGGDEVQSVFIKYSNPNVTTGTNITTLRFNPASGTERFRYYKTSTNSGTSGPVQLYKQGSGEGFHYKTNEVSDGLYNFIRDAYTCDGLGSVTSWSEASQKFSLLEEADKALLKKCVASGTNNSSQTITTSQLFANFIRDYDKYAGTTDSFNDYIGRFDGEEGAGTRSTQESGISLFGENSILGELSTATWIIALIAVSGLSCIGGYFFYRKRKENI